VWTDHKNLEYLHTAKRLNSRQARWALLFTWFNFSLSNQPGSKNVKPDALSHCYSPTTTTLEPETILPTSCLARAPGSGSIGKQVREVQRSQPNPGGPLITGCSFLMPSALRSWSGPTLQACLPPGTCRSLAFVRQLFWWPIMVPDMSAFFAACTVCAQNKTPRHAPTGLLQPLPVP
jgi:hypothetical protein